MAEDVKRLVGRCIGCMHPFDMGPCGGCGAVEQCDGACHEQDRDDCPRCCSRIPEQWCADCRAYAAGNTPVIPETGRG